MEANDTRIKKAELKTLTATVYERASYVGQSINDAAQFNGIGGSCVAQKA